MNNGALLIDFGATRIKSAIFNVQSNSFFDVRDWDMFNVAINSEERHEIPAIWLKNSFMDILSYYYNSETRFNSCFLCSQMHGFIVADQNNSPLSGYISWRDHRSLIPNSSGRTSFLLLEKALAKYCKEESFRAKTGMRLRPSLPIANFYAWIQENGEIIQKINSNNGSQLKLLSLIDWLTSCFEHGTGIAHSSMLAGLGLWNLKSQQIDQDLVRLFQEELGVSPIINRSGTPETIAGYWPILDTKIPIFAGVGDHQCALLGANNHLSSLSFNIGTGSQVSRIVTEYEASTSEVEYRPYFDGLYLRTITHIPGGRVLALFVDFLQQIKDSSQDDVWLLLSELSCTEIQNSKLIMDLSIFPGSWGYNPDGGCIRHIFETSWNTRSYLASLLRCFIEQYISASNCESPNFENISEIVLSGGVPRKLPQLINVIKERLKMPVVLAGEVDETLAGLKKIAKSTFEKQILQENNS